MVIDEQALFERIAVHQHQDRAFITDGEYEFPFLELDAILEFLYELMRCHVRNPSC